MAALDNKLPFRLNLFEIAKSGLVTMHVVDDTEIIE